MSGGNNGDDDGDNDDDCTSQMKMQKSGPCDRGRDSGGVSVRVEQASVRPRRCLARLELVQVVGTRVHIVVCRVEAAEEVCEDRECAMEPVSASLRGVSSFLVPTYPCSAPRTSGHPARSAAARHSRPAPAVAAEPRRHRQRTCLTGRARQWNQRRHRQRWTPSAGRIVGSESQQDVPCWIKTPTIKDHRHATRTCPKRPGERPCCCCAAAGACCCCAYGACCCCWCCCCRGAAMV